MFAEGEFPFYYQNKYIREYVFDVKINKLTHSMLTIALPL